MWYGFLADVIVAVHLAYVLFVVLGQLAILVGVALKWDWVRNRWFRLAHFLAILIVALEAVFAIECPLTDWEYQLRRRAGQDPSGETFIGRLLHELLFFEAPTWVFTTCYIGFALLVLATLVLAPPRWRGRRPAVGTGVNP
jgi:hypothetical protein